MPILACPLCLSDDTFRFFTDKNRDYDHCHNCQLVFVPANQHLSCDAEKAIYDYHQNQMDDVGYRQFLSRLATPMQDRLTVSANGLDYGCGPGPLLAKLFTEQGHHMQIFDPYYAPNMDVLQEHYDFVTCTEVIEHFRQPNLELHKLFGLLKPYGILGIMTKLVIDADAFSRWHYKNDLTHVSFFSRDTLKWLAIKYQCRLDILGNDVIIFTRNH